MSGVTDRNLMSVRRLAAGTENAIVAYRGRTRRPDDKGGQPRLGERPLFCSWGKVRPRNVMLGTRRGLSAQPWAKPLAWPMGNRYRARVNTS